MTALKELKAKLLKDPAVLAEYEALKLEERLAAELVRARVAAGLSQAQLATQLGIKQSAVARFESGRHMPSIDTLQAYASATGRRLVVGLKARPASRSSSV